MTPVWCGPKTVLMVTVTRHEIEGPGDISSSPARQPLIPPPDTAAITGTRAVRRRRVRPHAWTRGRAVKAGAATATVAVLTAAWFWPTGLVAERPGAVLQLSQRVAFVDPPAGASPMPINGAYDGLSVSLDHLGAGQWLLDRLKGDPSHLVPASTLQPPAVDPGLYHRYEKSLFVDGGQTAAAVAERSLGYRVSATSDGIEILAVDPHSAAAGTLAAGQTITAVNGKPVMLRSDLEQAIDATPASQPILITVRDGKSTRTVAVTPAVAGLAKPALGVIVAPRNPLVDLAVPVTIDASGVVGPSAGLMTALTVYDKLSPTDLASGRQIAGTGTLSIDGRVGRIGGIEAKARAAEKAGAQLFLAPAPQAEAARAVLGDRIPVIAVTTFDQAVAALTGPGSVSEPALPPVRTS